MSVYSSLDATAKGANANSYATEAEADDYNDGIPAAHTADWDAATTTSEVKEDALMTATRLLDEQVEWEGTISDQDQRLRWPRTDVFDADNREYDGDTIPQWLKDATSEYARLLIGKYLPKEPTRGIDMLKTGEVTIDFNEYQVPRMLPRSVRSLIPKAAGTIKGASMSRAAVRT